MDDTEPQDQPVLDPAAFERLQAAFAGGGAVKAADALIAELRAAEDFNNLFYALLLKKRIELGVSPFPTGPAADLPPHTHEPYEQTIREAGRHVGQLFLERGQFPQAWNFFRMLGEPEPVREALERFEPGPDTDIYPIIEIAWQGGVLPKKGFDLILDRHGVCSAITTVSSSDINSNPDLRDYCIGRLVRAIHEQLTERLRSDLESRGTPASAKASIKQMCEESRELFGEDAYHIDTSHLSSACQMSLYLPAGEENALARELCEYGRRLSPTIRGGGGDAPFEEMYDDFLPFLNVIAGVDVEKGLARFKAKAEREAAEGATYAAQVYVNLLVRIGKLREAFEAAQNMLAAEDERNLICPGVSELAKRLNDYGAMAEAARVRRDAVGFLAGLIAGSGLYLSEPRP
ncbi:MAG TPA: hypothetical protein VGI99_08255 [Gemmataceae bacterium]|jgi:hypothetical protein